MTVSFNKARNRWAYDFVRAGRRYQGYCLDATGAPVTSKSAARQAEAVEMRRVEMAPKIARPGEMTIGMCIAALMPEWEKQACWSGRHIRIREILSYFGAETGIGSIDQAKVDDYVTFCKQAKVLLWKGGPALDPAAPANARYWQASARTRSIATVQLYLGTLRQLFERAAKHRDPETGKPVFDWLPTVPDPARPKRKARPTPDQVSAEVMSIMPPHVVDGMMLTAFFGFRAGEAWSLLRTQIDWDATGIRLAAEDVKDDEDAFLPASQFAMGYLWCLDMEAEARGARHLLTFPRKRAGVVRYEPIKKPRSAWRRAQAFMRAKYGKTWRWHDLRAAFISHVALKSGGVVAQALARHSDPETTQAYIEVADEMRRLAAERISDRAVGIAANETPLHDSLTVKFRPAQGRRKAS